MAHIISKIRNIEWRYCRGFRTGKSGRAVSKEVREGT
jgi:hypothetical protein